MARYTRSSVDAVRDAVDMVDLVSARTELRRAGARSFMGICPFHEERSPSFSVEPVDKLYHCFGCQASGDAFTFVQETEGVEFKEAVELLAERYGVQLEVDEEDPRDAERRRARDRLLELLERTAAYYVRYLWDSREAAKARQYLIGRGLEEATLREFRVGYAPSGWDKVLMASRRAGFSNRELYDAGLAQRAKGEGQIYDRFRARITFPLCDLRGRVLGFGARAMSEERGPKYLNTPENDIFHKGRVLFGADLARAHAARAGQVITVEGYTDVLALHQGGLRNAVGIMGTSLTDQQVAELARLAPVVLLALDSDSAGQDAILRASRVAAGRKLELRVVPLPEGMDPADVVASPGGAAELAGFVESSVPFVRFRVERALATGDLEDAEGKDRVLAALRPVFAELPRSVLREELLALVAERMSLEESLVASLLSGRAPGRSQERPRAAAPAERNGGVRTPGPSPAERQEREFLAYCVARPELGGPALAGLELDADLTSELNRRAAAHLRAHLDAPAEGLGELDDEVAAVVRAVRVRAGQVETGPGGFAAERLQLALARVDRELAAARRAGAGDLATIAARRETLRREFNDAVDRALEEQGRGSGRAR